jgi:hypothetical protein
MSTPSTERRAVIGIRRPYGERLREIPLPTTFTEEHLARIRRDAEILASKLAEKPEVFAALLAAVTANQLDKGTEHLVELGLTEDQLKAEGGGFLWLVVAVVVIVIALYPTDAY